MDRNPKPLNIDLALVGTMSREELGDALHDSLEQINALRNQVAALKEEVDRRGIPSRALAKIMVLEEADGVATTRWLGPAARKRVFQIVEDELREAACNQLLIFDDEISAWRPIDAQGTLCGSLYEIVEVWRERMKR